VFDLRHPFFLPLWRRIALTAFCAGWAALELAGGSGFWAVIVGALAAFCVYEFFIVFDAANYAPRKDGGEKEPGPDGE
jgi:hypothetical protein